MVVSDDYETVYHTLPKQKNKKSSNSLTVNTVKSNRPVVDLNWPEENTFVLKIFANNKPYIFVL